MKNTKLAGLEEVFPESLVLFYICSILDSLACYNCQTVALRQARSRLQSQSKAVADLGHTRGLLLLSQGSVLSSSSCSLGPFRKLGDQLVPSCPSTCPLSCLPLGQIWCRSSPLGRMTSMTRLRTLLAPGCGGFRTDFTRALDAPSLSSMAVESSSTALVLCPTADPSPLWVSLDAGWEGKGYRVRGLHLCSKETWT